MSASNPQQRVSGNLTAESASVQNYLGILQGIITRLANNSANCKTWCISLVSAILVVIADKGKPNYAWIALIPVLLFCILDAYYLAQERAFRDIYNNFIESLHTGNAKEDDLFILKPMRGFHVVKALYQASLSFSIYPFYVILFTTLIIARYLVL